MVWLSTDGQWARQIVVSSHKSSTLGGCRFRVAQCASTSCWRLVAATMCLSFERCLESPSPKESSRPLRGWPSSGILVALEVPCIVVCPGCLFSGATSSRTLLPPPTPLPALEGQTGAGFRGRGRALWKALPGTGGVSD